LSGLDLLGWGPERLRVGPWRGDDRVAYVAPLPDAALPSPDAIRRSLAVLAKRGYAEAVTAALSPGEQPPFTAAGFAVRERLHLLAHNLLSVPEATTVGLRRPRRGERGRVLELDTRAFPPFWRLDDRGLRDALAATPSTRFRVAGGGGVAGYAITGRAGRRGYLQRLAVDPDHQRQGLGRALVVDALRWLRRRGADEAVVNTQFDNRVALALYEDLGFRRQPGGLAVLTVRLDTPATGEPAG
jgi:ribosomal protein S18 acetylase RimI-like enzyme